MSDSKFKLSELKVNSFVTTEEMKTSATVKGGTGTVPVLQTVGLECASIPFGCLIPTLFPCEDPFASELGC